MRIRPLLSLVPFSLLPAQDVPLGVEAVTTFRSDYLFRGFHLAQQTLEFQIATEIAFGKDQTLGLGLFDLSEGSGSFRQSGLYLDWGHTLSENLQASLSLTAQAFQDSALESGTELGLTLDYTFTEDWSAETMLFWDLRSAGLYGASELSYSNVLSPKSFFSAAGGISYTASYFDRSGLNDVFARASYTYGLTDSLAWTPFLGLSVPLTEERTQSRLFFGLNLEVFF